MFTNRKHKDVPEAGLLFNKLAAGNVKKSTRDYYIYFFTLMFSISLFYCFNSISTQFASLGLLDTLGYLTFSSSVLTAFSILVCIIMGALVVYANRFLLKRRKKEMGVYAVLGMEHRDLNRILMKETLRIGIFSLAAGLTLGIFAAQILSLATARLAGISFKNYHFSISAKAIILSIIFFGLLFFFVHLFHVRGLKKMTLLEMLHAERKNETVPEGQGIAILLHFILGIAFILGGYGLAYYLSSGDFIKMVGASSVLLMAGTVFFISGVLRLALWIKKKNKKYYFRGLNMFTVSQYSTRLKTEGRTAAVMSILLYMSVTLSMLGPGVGKFITNGVEHAAPFDGTIFYAPDGAFKKEELPAENLKKPGFDIDQLSDRYESLWLYEEPAVTEGLFNGREQSGESNYPLSIIGVEDYNRILIMEKLEPVHLEPGEYGIGYTFPADEKAIAAFGRNPQLLNINSTSLKLAKDGIWKHPWKNNNILVDEVMIVVPQRLTNNLKQQLWILNFQYRPGRELSGRELHIKWVNADLDGYTIWSRDEVLISIMANNMLVTYLGIYLGITFLITAGAVLALKQLTHTSDLVKHYKLLKQLGVSKSDRNRSLKKHLGIYFGLPMILALLHSGVIAGCVFRNFKGMEPAGLAAVIGFSVLLVLSVFSVYIIVTYLCSRRILEI